MSPSQFSPIPQSRTGGRDDCPPADKDDDCLLDSAIADYLERLDRGEAVDRREFLARYPALTDDLQSFFENTDEVQRVVNVLPPACSVDSAAPRHQVSTSVAAKSGADDEPQRSTREMPADPPLQVPARYEIIRCVGQGGMGIVYLARDKDLDRHVAFKIPHACARSDPERLLRFFKEARAVAKLHHPSICQIFDVGELEGRMRGTPYITMAYIDGITLARRIGERGPFPSRHAASLIARIAAALQYAHRAGIVHRDLKPANIMINQNDEPIITDFGLALQLDQPADERLTEDGRLMGTPAYMSPEQFEGDPKLIGPSTDIYSLGVLLFELVSGRAPFEGSRAAIFAQLQKDSPPNLADIRKSVPAPLAAICRKMLSHDQHARYPDMQAVRDALEAFLKSVESTESSADVPSSSQAATLLAEPVDTVPVADAATRELPPVPVKPVRRSRTVPAVALSLAAILAVTGGKVLFNTRPGTTHVGIDDSFPAGLELRIDNEPREITAAGMDLPLSPGRHHWSVHRGEDLVLLDEFDVAEKGRGDVTLSLKAQPVETPSSSTPPSKPKLPQSELGFEEPVTALAIAPDRSRLVAADGHALHVLEYAIGRGVLTVPLRGDTRVQSIVVEPTGARLIVATPTRIYTISLAEENVNTRLVVEASFDTPATTSLLSPDGRRLAAATRETGVRLVSFAGSAALPPLAGNTIGVERLAFSANGDLLATASRDGSLRLWDLTTGTLKRSIDTHGQRAAALALSGDGSLLAAAGAEKNVVIYDAVTGEVVRTLVGHAGDVESLAFHPSGRFLASGSQDHSVRLWEVASGAELHRQHQKNAIDAIGFSSNGESLYAADGNLVSVWQLPPALVRSRSPGLISTLENHRGTVLTVAFSPDGRSLLTAGGHSGDAAHVADPHLRLWDVETGALRHVFESHLHDVKKARFSADGRLIIAMSLEGLFEFWDVARRERAHDFDGAGTGPVGRGGRVWDFDVAADRPQIVVVGTEGHSVVRLRDLETVTHWKRNEEKLSAVACWSDGRSPWLISGSLNSDTVTTWNSSLVESSGATKTSGPSVMALAVTPDGRYALCGNREGFTYTDLAAHDTLHTWNKFQPGQPTIYDRWIGAISRDGAHVLLATQSSPPILVLIDAASGEPIQEFHGHGGSGIAAIAIAPDGQVAASGGLDGKVKLWRLPATIDVDRRAAEWTINSGGTVVVRDPRSPSRTIGARHIDELPTGPFECVAIQFDGLASFPEAGLKCLAGLRHLEELRLTNLPLYNAGLAHLRSLPRLQKLLLDGTHITDDGTQELRRLPALKTLSLRNTSIAGTNFSSLIGLPLQDLNVDGTAFADDSLRWLKGFRRLENLYVGRTPVTDAGLASLAQCESLKLLDYQESRVTAAGAENLKRALPRLRFGSGQ